METGFRLRVLLRRERQPQLPLEPMELGLPEALPSVVCYCQCLGQHGKPFWSLSHAIIRLGEPGKIRRPPQCGPHGLQGGAALAHLRHPLFHVSLYGQRPLSYIRSQRQVQRKPLLVRERYGGLRTLLGHWPLPAQVMHQGGIVKSRRQADGVRQLLGQGERLVDPCEGLVWIAEQPQGPSHIGEAPDPEVKAITKGQRAVLLGIIEGRPLFQVRAPEAALPGGT